MKFGRGHFKDQAEAYPFRFADLRNGGPMEVFLGLPQWNVPGWKKDFYSANCQQTQFLVEYAKRLPCVEVSSTFYADIGQHTIHQWCQLVPETFYFLPKWPQWMTHHQLLKVQTKDILLFCETLKCFGKNLGASILQLPPSFSDRYKKDLFQFLEAVPEDIPLNLEFRHPSWFKNNRVFEKLADYLTKKSIGMVCSDTSARRDVFHLSFTGSSNIIRYLSDENLENDRTRLQVWSQWLESQNYGGKIFFTLHRPNIEESSQLIALFQQERVSKIAELRELAKPQLEIF